jgi:hypothetical protein
MVIQSPVIHNIPLVRIAPSSFILEHPNDNFSRDSHHNPG